MEIFSSLSFGKLLDLERFKFKNIFPKKQQRFYDTARTLPVDLRLKDAENYFSKFGLAQLDNINESNKPNHYWFYPIPATIVHLIAILRSTFCCLLQTNDHFVYVWSGDFWGLMAGGAPRLYLHWTIFTVQVFLLYSQYRYATRPPFDWFGLFRVLSGEIPASEIGLRNPENFKKVYIRAKVLFKVGVAIAKSGKPAIAGAFGTITFLTVPFNWQLLPITPWLIVTILWVDLLYSSFCWQITYFLIGCYYMKKRTDEMSERAKQLAKLPGEASRNEANEGLGGPLERPLLGAPLILQPGPSTSSIPQATFGNNTRELQFLTKKTSSIREKLVFRWRLKKILTALHQIQKDIAVCNRESGFFFPSLIFALINASSACLYAAVFIPKLNIVSKAAFGYFAYFYWSVLFIMFMAASMIYVAVKKPVKACHGFAAKPMSYWRYRLLQTMENLTIEKRKKKKVGLHCSTWFLITHHRFMMITGFHVAFFLRLIQFSYQFNEESGQD